jgi:voltage-dependent anion channel protein 2
MAPPKFADLGKAVKNLFSDDYNVGEAKVTIKSKASNGVNLKIDGSRQDSGAVSGSVETKFAHSSGVAIKEKWNTNNNVATELTLENNNPLANTKFIVESTFNPNAGFSGIQLTGEHALESVYVTAALSKAAATVTDVFGYQNLFLGSFVKYDFAKRNVTDNKISVSYVEKDVIFTSSITNLATLEGSVYLNPPKGFETVVRFSWNRGSNDTTFEIGAKKTLDSSSFFKAKVDKGLNFGLSYSQRVGTGVTATLSAMINGKQLVADGHSLGLALNFDN